MHGHDPFLLLTAMTLGAALLVWLLQRLRLSPIIGYLALGILVAPWKDWLLPAPEAAEALAEFGVVLLMFFIGLDFHLAEMRQLLKLCLGGGVLQVVLTAAAAGLAAWLCGAPPPEAGVIGLMISFSSTALVMKAYEERRESDSYTARTAVAVLLLQDLAAILAVAVLPVVAGLTMQAAPASTSAPGAGAPFTKMLLLFVVLPLAFLGARYALPRLFERTAVARLPEAFSLLSLGACLVVALAAREAGASLALGAFLGGLVLCETPFSSQIMADLTALRNLALAFFFVSVGMLVDLSFVGSHLLALAAAVAGVLLLKMLLMAGVLAVLRVPLAIAAAAGLALAQVGEFSFVLGREALALGLIEPRAYQFVLVVGVATMAVTPFLVAYSKPFGRKAEQWLGVKAVVLPEDPPPTGTTESLQAVSLRAVVVGYGPVGKTLTRILMDFGIQPAVIDLNLETVKKLTAIGIKAIYGDAGRREILEKAGIKEAAYLLVTLPDLPGRLPVVATARLMNPGLKIFTRARYLAERSMLEDAGASAVSYEECEVAVGLATHLLREIGAKDEDIGKEGERIRAEINLRTGFTMIPPRNPKS